MCAYLFFNFSGGWFLTNFVIFHEKKLQNISETHDVILQKKLPADCGIEKSFLILQMRVIVHS